MPSPRKRPKEKAAPASATSPHENHLTDSDNLGHTQETCKRKSVVPGYGFDEDNTAIPVALPPSWEPEPDYAPEQLAAARFALVLLAWAIPRRTRRSARLAALDLFLHRDKRTAKQIAKECRCTANAIRAELRNLRALAREVAP